MSPTNVITDDVLDGLAPLSPRKRLAVLLLRLYQYDILDETEYGMAVCRAVVDPPADADAGEEGGPLC